MKNRAFSFIEVIVSMSLFLITIFPIMELNREMLKINRKYMEIEQSEKNFHLLEKNIVSKGYKFLSSNLGNYEYTIGKNQNINYIFGDIKFLYENNKDEKILLFINKTIFSDEIEQNNFVVLKVEFHSKNRIFKKEKLISEYDEYY
ncbi:hypothetical protein [Fusobacterium sp.]|uniref:hypothetical protein n=1 Tax=Fusobacterium sp. TaxID=68766 RepID=UPI002900F656|nr:hypothetical protein [Fusobacterium sp.]MDU1911001.1 hypothetical protein [Fusobacterium sp.]